MLLVLTPVPAFAEPQESDEQVPAYATIVPTITVTLFDNDTVVVGGDHFPGKAQVKLQADLTYEDGAGFSGVGTVRANATGHFVVGFLLPDHVGVVGLMTVTASARDTPTQTSSFVIGPGTLPLGPVSTPTEEPSETPKPGETSSPSTATPSQPGQSSGSANADNAVSHCPSGGQLSGAPSGNEFSGHSYNGHGQTLPKGNYSISSNTCIENYVFDGSNLTLKGTPSNVTIVNNLFQNWPAKQAIANVTGTNITINFNTVKATSGGAWTGIFGQGTMTNVTITHNDIQNLGAAVDGIQLRFTGVGTNVEIAYNRITDNGRFPIELQQVAHGLRVHDNYATVRNMGGDQLGQLSIATGNDKDGGGYYDSDTYGVVVENNIVINNDGKSYPACIESRGNGNILQGNYCKNYNSITDYAMTNNSSPNPWYVRNNILVGPKSGTFSWYEGFNRSGYQYVKPTESGNKWFPMNSAPAVPAWNYAAGRQG